MRIWIEQRGSGDTAWLVDGEPWLVGATRREAERRQHTLEVMASPEARAIAREHITGAIWTRDN